jgi:hypothetical protein
MKCSKRSLHDLARVLVRRPCGDPSEMLSEVPRRSLRENLVEAMAGSSRGPCMILHRSL